ncbi:hypothetical protein SU69_00760 [Thermosipho melanesiensis]|uniref:Uncharacterized protein n=2 Tax=Thermosipho melanesiensis TaxID=46541 RepID=A6LJB6_THEM4|nr:hypothetical protein [Thermosipho melanesiensis]ABR30017.1 hypothetical protein Tmel_0140 [Thermosipho melanesiensis BI429]APT74795.1 hypothetical protein BW47_00785 [Thermosipho melanesiensis]OOC38612.1 hypothetical protein SU68_00760 [Thermosipho melanesiensis]OOC40416.1 hypothetical protein SU70_00760 [Thermosipho melanesiensis]OOC40681.1 hypothetical protein SU69_00760 [Thermosipho melanesiensis]
MKIQSFNFDFSYQRTFIKVKKSANVLIYEKKEKIKEKDLIKLIISKELLEKLTGKKFKLALPKIRYKIMVKIGKPEIEVYHEKFQLSFSKTTIEGKITTEDGKQISFSYFVDNLNLLYSKKDGLERIDFSLQNTNIKENLSIIFNNTEGSIISENKILGYVTPSEQNIDKKV